MTWDEASQLMDRELKAIQTGVPDLPQLAERIDLVPNALLNLESETHDALNEAVSVFIAKRRWPPLSFCERTMLVFRLEFAASLSHLLGFTLPGMAVVVPEPSLDVADEHVLEWLLIGAWQIKGFGSLIDPCDRLARGMSNPQSPRR